MLALICRESGREKNYQGRVLVTRGGHAERQSELEDYYRRYDLRCLCVEHGVRMHIKHRIDTGLFYVSDNPSALLHAESCELARARRLELDDEQGSEGEKHWDLPESFTLIPKARAQSRASVNKARVDNSDLTKSSLFKRLIYTLLDESFSCYFHGRTTTAYTAAKAISESDFIETLPETYSGSPFTVFYGLRGMDMAFRKLNSKLTTAEDYCIHIEKTPMLPGFVFKVLWFDEQLSDVVVVREFRMPSTSVRCFTPVFHLDEQPLLQALERWVRGNVKQKAFFGRRLRPFFIDGVEYDSPIIAGVTDVSGKRLRFITLTRTLPESERYVYERRFNAEYVPLDSFLARICSFIYSAER